MIYWDRMRELRDKQGLTNKRIAELTGVDERTVSRVMKGETENPGIEMVLRMVTVMGGSLDRLTGIAPERRFDDEPLPDKSILESMQEHLKAQQDEKAILAQKIEAQASAIDQQRDTISHQNATICEQRARLEAKIESIQHRDRIIVEKDLEIKTLKDSLKRQAMRYTVTVILFIVGILYLYWDGSNPTQGLFQYGQIVPVEGMIGDAFKWVIDRVTNMIRIM